MSERVVYSQDGKPIGVVRIPAEVERLLWRSRPGERVRMPVREPVSVINDDEIIKPVRMPVIDLSVQHWRYREGGAREFGPITAWPLDMVKYQMALQTEEDAKAEARARPSEAAYDAWDKATDARKKMRDKVHNLDAKQQK